MDDNGFRNVCAILHNLDLHELEQAGVITPGAVGGSDWTRFNTEPLMFVLKLPDARREALWKLVEERQPPQPDPLEKPREAFLNMIADAKAWEEDVDGDVDSNGRAQMYISYRLETDGSPFEEFTEALGIKAKWGESLKDAIDRLASEPAKEVSPS